MIDYERLTYPGGVAVATILKSPGAGVLRKAITTSLIASTSISATVHAVVYHRLLAVLELRIPRQPGSACPTT